MLNKINFYQLDNLINNRVPFLFFNLSEESLAGWYTSLSRLHVESYENLCGAAEVLPLVESKKTPKDYAIVLLCADGKKSLEIYGTLAAQNYTNVYVVDGGIRQMMTEKAQI